MALKYQKMINDPKIGCRTVLARKPGVSRAHVTKVMRELKCVFPQLPHKYRKETLIYSYCIKIETVINTHE